MREIVTEIDMRASAACVWGTITDFASYSAWNPAIRSVDGRLAEGRRLRLALRQDALASWLRSARALSSFLLRLWCAIHDMRIAVRVTRLRPQRELRWKGTVLLPRLFEAEHFFRISERTDGCIRFVQGERYSGLLEPLFRDAIEGGNLANMHAVNEALKRRVEAASVPHGTMAMG